MAVVQIVKKRINLGFYGNPMNTVQCIGQPMYIPICCIIPYIARVKIVRNQNFFSPDTETQDTYTLYCDVKRRTSCRRSRATHDLVGSVAGVANETYGGGGGGERESFGNLSRSEFAFRPVGK